MWGHCCQHAGMIPYSLSQQFVVPFLADSFTQNVWCGRLQASAACGGAAGYSPDAIMEFVSRICRSKIASFRSMVLTISSTLTLLAKLSIHHFPHFFVPCRFVRSNFECSGIEDITTASRCAKSWRVSRVYPFSISADCGSTKRLEGFHVKNEAS